MSGLSNLVGQMTGEVTAPVVEVPAAPKKADLARAIFDRMYGQPGVARKDIIKAFVNEAGLTEKGAATYFQNIKDKKGLVNKRS